MPVLAFDRYGGDALPGQRLAVWAQALYLLNLLLLPGIAFALLLALYLARRAGAPPLALNHLRQTVAASLWAGVLLLLINGATLLVFDYRDPATWIVVILYFVTCHAALVLLGALGLVKALAGQRYRFPLIGPEEPSLAQRGSSTGMN